MSGIGIILLFLLSGLCVSGAAPAGAAGPLSALARAQEGIDTCDSGLFNSAVDLGAITDKAATALLSAMRKASVEGRLEGPAALIVSLAGTVSDGGQDKLIRQLLHSEIKSFLAAGINSGWFAGRENPAPGGRGFASYLKNIPRGRREIVPGKIVSEAGDKAVVTGRFIDPQAGALPLLLELERRDGVWRVVEIKNAAELFTLAGRGGG
ncbi:MAG: hypothetical protein LBU06_07700 [Desulfovibrio sp.]|nr:hypothetical protein [Desulfovibrio sp.]